MFTRYAIYFVPEGIWGDLGTSWLGWDSRRGCALPSRAPDALIKRPRKYGFHATIKPPFRLADGAVVADLVAALETCTSNAAPIALNSLQIVQLGRFFALTAPRENDLIRPLASDAVRRLDPFRAPLNDNELARRRRARLTPRHEELLAQWGYPYVMDQFDFHLTLTGPTKDPEAVSDLVHAHFYDALQTPLVFDSLSLLGEDAEGLFHEIARFPLLQV